VIDLYAPRLSEISTRKQAPPSPIIEDCQGLDAVPTSTDSTVHFGPCGAAPSRKPICKAPSSGREDSSHKEPRAESIIEDPQGKDGVIQPSSQS
jgi:hypothetical protein